MNGGHCRGANLPLAYSLFTLTLTDSFTRSPTVAVDLPEQAQRAVPVAATADAAGAYVATRVLAVTC